MREVNHRHRALLPLVALFLCGAAHAQSPPTPAPTCWPSQLSGGTGASLHVGVNLTGWVVRWICPDGTHPFVMGHWSAMAANWQSQLGSLTTTNALTTWNAPANNLATVALADMSPGGAFYDLMPLYASLDYQGSLGTVGQQNVYMAVRTQDGYALLVVGTIPGGIPCDITQQVNGLYVVPTASVTWAGNVQPTVVVAKCGQP